MTEIPVASGTAGENPSNRGDLFPRMLPLLEHSRRWRTTWGILGGVAVLLAVAATGSAWFIAIPHLYAWGFRPPSWVALPSAVAILFLAVIPLLLLGPGFNMIGQAIRAAVD